MINDYDISFHCHEPKANVMADALSRKISHELTAWIISKELRKKMESLNLKLVRNSKLEPKLCALVAQPKILEKEKLQITNQNIR